MVSHVPQVVWDRKNKVWTKITLRALDRNSAMKVKEWCEDSLGGLWMTHVMSYAFHPGSKSGMIVYRFENPSDALAFKLRWWTSDGFAAAV